MKINELSDILRLHTQWLESNKEGKRADLSNADLSNADLSNADLILAGQDIRGYLFSATKNDDGVVIIRAGCRKFAGISAARRHWQSRHEDDEVLHADCLSLVDRIERMASVRGWLLEPSGLEAIGKTNEQ